jgi:chaperonin cofactor prefoldin
MQEMDDFTTLADSVRKKKGRMDASARKKGADLIAAILTAPEPDFKEMLVVAEELQSEAVADGIGMAWSAMPPERRIEVRRWIPAPHTERSQRRVALLAAALAETDSTTALELLDGLIPDRPPSKELKRLIVTSLFADGRVIAFDNLAKASVRSRLASRVFGVLANLSFEANSGIEHMPRYLLCLAIVNFVATQKLEQSSEGRDLLSKVGAEAERWPQGLREKFEGWLKNERPELMPQFSIPTRPLVPARVSDVTDHPQVASKLSVVPETAQSRIDQYLDERARSLTVEMTAWSHFRAVLAERLDELQRQIDASKNRESELNKKVSDLWSSCTALEGKLSGAMQQIKELEQALGTALAEKKSEHEKLTQQITANAHGRVAEFKNQVALTLARHLVDLPNRETPVSPELGRVLLLQFHQLVDVLAELGIKIPNGRSGRQ